MARHNFVQLMGFVRKPPRKVGPYATILLSVLAPTRSQAASGIEGYAGICIPAVITLEEKLVGEIMSLEVNDIVFVKGFLGTRQELKNYTCPECGYQDDVKVMSDGGIESIYGYIRTYVHPIYILRFQRLGDVSMEDAVAVLREQSQEISNIVFLVGNVTSSPIPGKWTNEATQEEIPVCRYKIAVNRKYCASGMEELCEDTDFPVIYTFGNQAKWDAGVLQTGSSVYVDGSLVTRRVRADCKCPRCGTLFHVQDTRMEVVGNSVEYGHGIDFDSYYAMLAKAKESPETDSQNPRLFGGE